MRNLTDVIDQVLKEIPETEAHFRARLNSLKISAAYTPPEGMTYRWRQGAYILSQHMDPKNLNEWQARVKDIWMNVISPLSVKGESR